MTMPDERTRALVWAGAFLIEIARDKSLPLAVRQRAVVIARHFPTVEQLGSMARNPSSGGLEISDPEDAGPTVSDSLYGPLRYSTRLEWPSD